MKKILLALFVIVSFCELSAQSVTVYVGSSPFQDSLWTVDTTTLQVRRRLGPTPSSGGTITGMNGIAKDPTTGEIYIICKQSAQTGRSLGKLNPLTGAITIIGNLGDNFSSITFTSNGRLFGATGNGATVSEGLYSIDKTTGAKTLIKVMGNGADGEIICANPDDNNLLYHWSGNGTVVYEKLDTLTGPYAPTNIPIIGTTSGETFGAVYIGNGKFVTSNISSSFNRFNTAGNVTPAFGQNPDDLRGLVLMTCSRAITGNTTICAGDSTVLTHGSGTVGASYQWYLNGVAIPGATSRTYTATLSGHYNCRVSDECSSNDSSGVGINITVAPLPSVNVGASSTALCAGDSALLTANAPSGTYQWLMNGVPIGGATTSNYSTTTAGVYNMICVDANGCIDTAVAGVSIVVNALPVVSVSAAANAFCAGDSTQLTANAPSGNYQWFLNGVAIGGATSSTYVTTAGGLFNMVCLDGNGCSDSSATGVTINVNQNPIVGIGPDSSYCGSVTLDAGNPGATYLWCDGSTTQTTTLVSSGSCMVMVTDSNGCSSSDTINVIVNPNPIVVLGPDVSACTQVVITADSSLIGGTFLWCTGGTGLNEIITNSTTCDLQYTDVNGCMGYDTINVTIFGNPTVTASATPSSVCADDADVVLSGAPVGGTFSGSSVSGNLFDPTIGAGNYNITYTFTDQNGCTGTATTPIAVSACVGIEETNATGFTMYPNPTTGVLNFNLTENSSVEVFDVLGNVVAAKQFTTGNATLDLSNQPNGVYFVRVNGANAQRVVIQK